mgnify:CR=1 FL=1
MARSIWLLVGADSCTLEKAIQTLGWMWPVRLDIVELRARLTATHAPNGLAASVWDRASKAWIGITLAAKRPLGCRPALRTVLALMAHATPNLMLNAKSG